MFRRTAATPPESAFDESGPEHANWEAPGSELSGPGHPDLSTLSIAGLTQRRVAILLSTVVVAWIVLLFARQVGDASAASARAEAMVADNAVRHSEIAGLERELSRIQQRRFILLQARGHGLGGRNEIAFTLDPDAPPLIATAPGSAALRVGAPASVRPLDSWLNMLFGAGD